MKSRLKIAIIGRPNVGKSSLFNRIVGKKLAIVEDEEGVTRDRLYADVERYSMPFTLIDTGGIGPGLNISFNEEIKRQAEIAFEEADLLVLVVDGQVPPTRVDKEIAKELLKIGKPLVLAINKCDGGKETEHFYSYVSLGVPEMIAVSASHDARVADLIDALLKKVNPEDYALEPVPAINIAIVGKPNVGKSTLFNFIMSEERSIVSEIPGTTRDAIDSIVEVDGKIYRFVDTAGIKRKRAEKDSVEKFASIRTQNAIERADICVLVLDAANGITQEEKKIARQIEKSGKGCLLFLNKWDLVKGFRMEHCLKGLHEEVPFLAHCPTIFGSAKTGRNVDQLFFEVNEIYAFYTQRISTGPLNRFLEKAMQKTHPPMIDGKRLRIYYMTQTSVGPPSFILFVNYPKRLTETYKKYLINQFRNVHGFRGCPLHFEIKARAQTQDRPSAISAHEEEEIVESIAEEINLSQT